MASVTALDGEAAENFCVKAVHEFRQFIRRHVVAHDGADPVGEERIDIVAQLRCRGDVHEVPDRGLLGRIDFSGERRRSGRRDRGRSRRLALRGDAGLVLCGRLSERWRRRTQQGSNEGNGKFHDSPWRADGRENAPDIISKHALGVTADLTTRLCMERKRRPAFWCIFFKGLKGFTGVQSLDATRGCLGFK